MILFKYDIADNDTDLNNIFELHENRRLIRFRTPNNNGHYLIVKASDDRSALLEAIDVIIEQLTTDREAIRQDKDLAFTEPLTIDAIDKFEEVLILQ